MLGRRHISYYLLWLQEWHLSWGLPNAASRRIRKSGSGLVLVLVPVRMARSVGTRDEKLLVWSSALFYIIALKDRRLLIAGYHSMTPTPTRSADP